MTARDTLPAARILHVDDQPESHEWLKLALERKGFEVSVATDGHSAVASFTTHRPDIVLLDQELPDQTGLEVLRQLKNADPLVEIVMLTGHGSVTLAVEAMREGAFNFVEKPVEFAVLDAVLDKCLAHRNLHAEAARLRMSAERRDGLGRLVGTSPAMRRLFDLIQLVSPTDASVLIRGENGTGKELVADAVHERSPRANGPIIKINCGAIPGELFESELFGHKRGAFTGALADKRGLIESADRGTLLLDEIGEMPANAQVKLLRVLQEKQVRRLGETRKARRVEMHDDGHASLQSGDRLQHARPHPVVARIGADEQDVHRPFGGFGIGVHGGIMRREQKLCSSPLRPIPFKQRREIVDDHVVGQELPARRRRRAPGHRALHRSRKPPEKRVAVAHRVEVVENLRSVRFDLGE